MPALSKSRSSKRNIIPYLRSCSSKLSLTALNSTSSFTALFTSSSNVNNGSSRDLSRFDGGTLDKRFDGHLSDVDENTRGTYAQGKENTSPSKAANFATLPSSNTFKRFGLSGSNSRSFGKSRSNFSLLTGRRAAKSNSTRGEGITISQPTLTPESRAHMYSKFNLVPVANPDGGLASGGEGGFRDLNGGSPSPSPIRNAHAGGGRTREREAEDEGEVLIISVESSRRIAAAGNSAGACGTGGGGLTRTTTRSRVPVPLMPLSEMPDLPQAIRTRA